MDKLKAEKLLKEVIFNSKAQEKWIAQVDPDFLTTLEIIIGKYLQDPNIDKAQIFRTGVMLGAVYERWRLDTPQH